MSAIDWLFKLLQRFGGGKTEEFKAITASYKELAQEYRVKIKEQEDRIKQLESLRGNLVNPAERETLLDNQQSFHREYIELITQHRDALEELYFLRYELRQLKNELRKL